MQNNLYGVQPANTFSTNNQFARTPTQTSQFYANQQNQQYFQQPSSQMQQISQQPEINTNMNFIQGGEATAKSIMLPNNSMYAFFDKELRQVLVKTVNQFGEPNVETFWYFTKDEMEEINKQMGIQSECVDKTNYVTQDQFAQLQEQLAQQIENLTKSLNNFKSKVGNMNKKDKEKS